MKKKMTLLVLIALIVFSCSSSKISQNPLQNSDYYNFIIQDDILVGKIPITYLRESDSSFIWFNDNYNKYNVKSELASRLKTHLSDIKIDVFLGTWCGDTRRMLPKLIKILEFVNYNIESVNYFALDHDKKGLDEIANKHKVLYVPTIIFYRNGKEINRIVENHLESVESDILNILTINNYKHSLLE